MKPLKFSAILFSAAVLSMGMACGGGDDQAPDTGTGEIDCRALVECMQACDTETCQKACDNEASEEVQTLFEDIYFCSSYECDGYWDAACLLEKCSAEYATCGA